MTASHQTGKMTTQHIGIRTTVHNPVPGSGLVLVSPHALSPLVSARWQTRPGLGSGLGDNSWIPTEESWPWLLAGVRLCLQAPSLSAPVLHSVSGVSIRSAVSMRRSARDSALAGELEMVAVVNQVMVNCDQCYQCLVKQGRSQCLVSDG